MNIKDLIKEEVIFMYYRKGELWYTTSVSNFKFPIPIDDTGDGTFLAKDRGMLFMRYMNRALKAIEKEKTVTT